MKYTLYILGALALIIVAFFAFNTYIYNEKQETNLPQEQQEELVSQYIEENISQLSPDSEVLVGTFYVTNIEFTGTNTGTVEYEDGHIALIADFTYHFDDGQVAEVELTNVRENRPE